jgi:PAS domain S-box-containing protein
MHEAGEQSNGLQMLPASEVHSRTLRDALRESRCLLDGFFISSPAGLAVLDRELRFHRVNDTLAAISGMPANDHLGKTAREVIPELADQIEPCMRNVVRTGRKLLNHEVCAPIPGAAGATGYWVANYFPILSDRGEISRIGCVLLDITDWRRSEESLRRLSGRLMDLQDEERRRIARELHDSVGQCLTAIRINLDTLNTNLSASKLDLRTAKALSEASSLAEQCASDTRTISYLLHPPLLDERGLASAIRWYADGFAQRSGIRLSLDLPSSDPRLPQPVKTTLFRIVQESLTNIHHHSGSTMAEIRLLTDAESVVLEVRDEGRGIPPHILRRCNRSQPIVGVGIAGMRERVRQLGGKFDIHSDLQGTQVRATVPLGGEV